MKNIISQEEKNRIDALCVKYDISNYSINPDGTIDVDGDVGLCNSALTPLLPLRFGKVSGDFECFDNRLTSLEGCPTSVGGDFWCAHNELTSLEGCPISVGGSFYCDNNKLISLEFSPTKVDGCFDCSENELTSLKHCPTSVGDVFRCSNNMIKTLEYCPTVVNYAFDVNRTDVSFKFFHIFYILLRDDYDDFDKESFDEVDEVEDDTISSMMTEAQKTFLKYQNDYEVWTPEFNEDNVQLLLDDIKDGLK